MDLLFAAIEEYLKDNHPDWYASNDYLGRSNDNILVRSYKGDMLASILIKSESKTIYCDGRPHTLFDLEWSESTLLQQISDLINCITNGN